MMQLCIPSTSPFRTCGAGRRSKPYIPSRNTEVSAGQCNDVYTPADDKSRLKWPRRGTVVMIEVSKETRGGIFLTIEEMAPHGEEPMEIVINDQLFYHAGDLVIPVRPDAGVDLRQGPSGPGPRPDNRGDANKEDHGEDDSMEGKSNRMSEFDLDALVRDLLENDFEETEGGGANELLVLMKPSSFMSPAKEPPASLSPVESMSLFKAYQRKGESKLLSESPRRRRIDASMRVAFLGTLPEEEWERYQSELEKKNVEAWTRVAFMESTLSIIRRYGTQSVIRVVLNQPIMRKVKEKLMESTESDGLSESVTEESAEESPIMRGRSVRRARKGLRKYNSMVKKLEDRVNNKVTPEGREVKGLNAGNVAGEGVPPERSWARGRSRARRQGKGE